MKIAMVFPGQGSQSVGMLKAYAGLPGVDETIAEARRAGVGNVVLMSDGWEDTPESRDRLIDGPPSRGGRIG